MKSLGPVLWPSVCDGAGWRNAQHRSSSKTSGGLLCPLALPVAALGFASVIQMKNIK